VKVELSNGAITASTTNECKIDARAIDVTVHTTGRETEVDATFWDKERTLDEYVSLRVTIKEAWFEPPEEDETGRVELAGNLTQFLSLDQARDQVRALNSALASAGDSPSEVEPVEHSVDLDILAQTIGQHISSIPDEYDFAPDIAEALKEEFKGQSLHMREDEGTQ
jgi:hypothetical protein